MGELPIESYFDKEEISWQNVLLLQQWSKMATFCEYS